MLRVDLLQGDAFGGAVSSLNSGQRRKFLARVGDGECPRRSLRRPSVCSLQSPAGLHSQFRGPNANDEGQTFEKGIVP